MIYNFNSLTFQVLSVEIFQHEEGFFKVKGRPYSALSFRLSGSGEFEAEGARFLSNAGDALFMPDGMDYQVRYQQGESIVVHFTQCNYKGAEGISLPRGSAVGEKFRELLKNWREIHSVNQAKSEIYGILRILETSKTETLPEDFIRCIHFLKTNFTDPDLKITALCRIGNMSESTLRRYFYQYYKMSPKQYLTDLRLTKAMQLLVEGRCSVKEIAQFSGFYDEKYFSRFFKSRYGKTPSSLLQKHGF